MPAPSLKPFHSIQLNIRVVFHQQCCSPFWTKLKRVQGRASRLQVSNLHPSTRHSHKFHSLPLSIFAPSTAACVGDGWVTRIGEQPIKPWPQTEDVSDGAESATWCTVLSFSRAVCVLLLRGILLRLGFTSCMSGPLQYFVIPRGRL